MTDIVSRLYDPGFTAGLPSEVHLDFTRGADLGGPAHRWAVEAADEIERLQVLVGEIQKANEKCGYADNRHLGMADWEDPRVQIAYRIQIDEFPDLETGEHSEGYFARRIVAEIDDTCLSEEAAAEIKHLRDALDAIESATSTADGLTPDETIRINSAVWEALAGAARKDEGQTDD